MTRGRASFAFVAAALVSFGCSGTDSTGVECLDETDCITPCEEACGADSVVVAACVDEICECVCEDEPAGCSEDAFDSIQVDVMPTDSFEGPSICPVVAETLLRQDAVIAVTNTSTSRGIRLGATLIRESDQQTIENGCEANALPGQTVEECIETTAAGCDGPISGPSTGAGGILLPGETTMLVPFVCENQFIYQPPNSNGTCGDALLENVVENWIVQGVYCEPGEDSAAFCENIAQTQIRFGTPSPNYEAVVTDACN